MSLRLRGRFRRNNIAMGERQTRRFLHDQNEGYIFFPFFESVTNSIAMIRSFGSTFLWSKRVFMKCEQILSKSRLIDSIFRGNRDLCNFQKINLQINSSNSSINRKSCRHFFVFKGNVLRRCCKEKKIFAASSEQNHVDFGRNLRLTIRLKSYQLIGLRAPMFFNRYHYQLGRTN